MIARASIFASLFLALVAQAQQPPAGNLGFEAGEVGKAPARWLLPLPSRRAGYAATIVTDPPGGPREGKRAVKFGRAGAKGAGADVGNLMQMASPRTLIGKNAQFSIKIRTALPAGARLQIWMRVDRAGGKRGAFVNTFDRALTGTADWRRVAARVPVAADATAIVFGVMLLGGGQVWLDDAALISVGTIGAGDRAAAALTPRGLRNLTALTRLLGVLRHFHPSDECHFAGKEWERIAIAAIERVEPAADDAALVSALTTLCAAMAPTARVVAAKKKPAPAAHPAPAGATHAVAWQHHGWGGLTGRGPLYRSRRVRHEAAGGAMPADLAAQGTPHVAELVSGVWCDVPLVCFVKGGATLPAAGTPRPAPDRPASWRRSGNCRSARLAGVAIGWNVFQHFYPYFGDVKVDWPAALASSLQRAATDENALAYLRTLRRLVAALKDGHGFVYHADDPATHRLPLLWATVEGKLVVTHLPARLAGIERGSVVTHIDGTRVADAIAAVLPEVSASTARFARRRALFELVTGPGDSKVSLTIEGAKAPVEVPRSIPRHALRTEPRPAKIAELRPGVVYFDISRVTDADFPALLTKLRKAKGIVVDFRGYPGRFGTGFLGYLTKQQAVRSPRWRVPIPLRPDRDGMQYRDSGWPVAPQRPRLTAKIAFVTDARAISYAETYLSIVRQFELGYIVGEGTAGTNGNVNPMKLLGSYNISWTGMQVRNHDGSRFHGVGVLPTHPAKRSVAGVKAGKDELLERAIALVLGK